MRRIELRRHAPRDPDADRLSSDGEILAERVGGMLRGPYAAVFTSPKKRAAQTAAWFLRGLKHQLPPRHGVAEGLAPPEGEPTDEDAVAAADAIRRLLAGLGDGETALAVGHTPILEAAVRALTGTAVRSLAECEGVVLVEEGEDIRIEREDRLE